MELNFFESEMKRLKEQWPNAYSRERMVIFYNAFRNVSNFDFRDAVTDCIANCKGAPLMKELTETISKVITIRKQREKIDQFDPLKAAIEKYLHTGESIADPEFVLRCKEVQFKLDTKKITQAQFQKEMDLLVKESDEICKKKGTYRDVDAEITKIIEDLTRQVYGDPKPFE